MKSQHLQLLGLAVGLFLAARYLTQRNITTGPTDAFANASDWYEDQWARLHGMDLSLTGNNPTPDHYSSLGMTNVMGWSYQPSGRPIALTGGV